MFLVQNKSYYYMRNLSTAVVGLPYYIFSAFFPLCTIRILFGWCKNCMSLILTFYEETCWQILPSVTDGEKYIVQVQSTIQICQFRIILRHIYAIKNRVTVANNNYEKRLMKSNNPTRLYGVELQMNWCCTLVATWINWNISPSTDRLWFFKCMCWCVKFTLRR